MLLVLTNFTCTYFIKILQKKEANLGGGGKETSQQPYTNTTILPPAHAPPIDCSTNNI